MTPYSYIHGETTLKTIGHPDDYVDMRREYILTKPAAVDRVWFAMVVMYGFSQGSS